jgi:hypothetical protein
MPQKLFIEALAMALLDILFAIYVSRVEGLWWDGLGWDGMGDALRAEHSDLNGKKHERNNSTRMSLHMMDNHSK